MTTLALRSNPYVGPRAFREDEKLFGRDREIGQLLNMVIAERIVLLHSPSGAGKTSLVRAGLIPCLREEGFQVLPVSRVNLEPPLELRLVEGFNRYTFSLITSFEGGLPQTARKPDAELAKLSLAAYLQEYPAEVDEAGGRERSQILILDQFEEILTVDPARREEKLAFFNQLGEALRDRGRWALFAMREDYMAALSPYVRAVPTRLEKKFRLDLLGKEAARQAIQRPAAGSGVIITETAAEKLVENLSQLNVQQPDGSFEVEQGEYVEPMQLQVVCFRLWERLSAYDRPVDEKDLEQFGNVDQSLADYYAERVQVAAQTTGVSERVIREWVDTRLIASGNIRGQVMKEVERTEGLDNRAIQVLQDAYLVRAEQRGQQSIWYELSHDRLIKPLKDNNAAWFNENLSILQRQAALWDRLKRLDDLLIVGNDGYGKIKAWAEEHPDLVTSTSRELAFLKACQDARDRARRDQERVRNRFYQAIAALMVLLAATAIILSLQAQSASVRAVNQESTAQSASTEMAQQRSTAVYASTQATYLSNIALSRLLSFQASNYRDSQFDLSLLLNKQAADISDSFEARNNLLSMLQTNLSSVVNEPGGSIRYLAISPDGRWLASFSCKTSDCKQNNLRIRDAQTGKSIAELLGYPGTIYAMAFNPAGNILATSGTNGSLILWDLSSNPVSVSDRHEGLENIYALGFNQTGDRLVWVGGSVDPKSSRSLSFIKFASVSIGKLENFQTLDLPGELNSTNSGEIKQLALGPGNVIAAGDTQGHVILWDSTTSEAKCIRCSVLPGQTLVNYGVMALAFSPDGNTLAAGICLTLDSKSVYTCSKAGIQLWDGSTGEQMGKPVPTTESEIVGLSFAPDQRIAVVYASKKGSFLTWQPAKDQSTAQIDIIFEDTIQVYSTSQLYTSRIIFDPEANKLVVGTDDGRLFFEDVASDYPMLFRSLDSQNDVYTMGFNKAGNILYTLISVGDRLVNGGPYNLLSWDGTSWKPNLKREVGSEGSLAGVDGGNDVLLSLTPVLDNDAQISGWKVEMQQLSTGNPLGSSFIEVADNEAIFSLTTNGRTLVSAGCIKSGESCEQSQICRWNILPGTFDNRPACSEVKLVNGQVTNLTLSANDQYLAWENHIQQNQKSQPKYPSEVWLVTNWMTRPEAKTITPSGSEAIVYSLFFSSDNKMLAYSDDNGNIVLWDVQAGKPIKQLSSPGNVYNFDFSPDGKLMITLVEEQDEDFNLVGCLRLWDLETTQALGNPFCIKQKNITVTAFSPDSKLLALYPSCSNPEDTHCKNGTVYLLDLDLNSWKEKACEMAGRNLTRDEWAQFLKDRPYQATCSQYPAGE